MARGTVTFEIETCKGCELCPDAVITVYRQNVKKQKVPVATISNVKENIRVTVDDLPAVSG